jgi:hypothetical protein
MARRAAWSLVERIAPMSTSIWWLTWLVVAEAKRKKGDRFNVRRLNAGRNVEFSTLT